MAQSNSEGKAAPTYLTNGQQEQYNARILRYETDGQK